MSDESMDELIRLGTAGRFLSDEEYMTIDEPDEEEENEDDGEPEEQDL